MSKNVPISFRKASESQFSEDVDLCFVTISHLELSDPIRVVWDTKDSVKDGFTFIGFQFDIVLLSDDENPPKASLSIQNVDQVIGETIRGLNTPPRMKIELLSSVDFDLTVTPRVPLNNSPGPVLIYSADKLFLTNVKVDVLTVTADIVGWNYLQRVWPGVRATQETFPGLFR